MKGHKRVEIWFSLQSDYCYFLIDRLLGLSSSGVDVVVRPVLGLVLRMPQATQDRSMMEQRYFNKDTERTAEYLNLPYARPDPSPIQLEPGSVWIATPDQPLIDRLYRLFVGANMQGAGLQFLDVVVRGLWNGSNTGWDKSQFLQDALSGIGLDPDDILANTSWEAASRILDENHQGMLDLGHWGVPLMAYDGEPFYGQDRFDQLIWRMGQ